MGIQPMRQRPVVVVTGSVPRPYSGGSLDIREHVRKKIFFAAGTDLTWKKYHNGQKYQPPKIYFFIFYSFQIITIFFPLFKINIYLWLMLTLWRFLSAAGLMGCRSPLWTCPGPGWGAAASRTTSGPEATSSGNWYFQIIWRGWGSALHSKSICSFINVFTRWPFKHMRKW